MLLSALSDWLTPEGITATVLLVTTLLGAVAAILERMGKKEAAAKMRAAQAQGATFARVATVAVKGLEAAKRTKGLDPATLLAVTEAIRAESTKEGTEDVLKPLVHAARAAAPDAPVEAVVRAATTRLEPRRVS